MRALLLVAAFCLVALSVPAASDAHVVTCGGGQVMCYVQCELSHRGAGPHHCAFDQPSALLP